MLMDILVDMLETEMILRRDPRLLPLIEKFELKEATDVTFLEQLHDLIAAEAHAVFDDLFADTNLEVGKALSKSERELKNLTEDKVRIKYDVLMISLLIFLPVFDLWRS
jgi:hypothetical protein